MNNYSKMSLDDLLEAFELNDISTFNKTQLKKIKSEKLKDINFSDSSMLHLPLKGCERGFFIQEYRKSCEVYEKIKKELEFRNK
tara:strand:+ start:440 stop:691 length:252 start_codon:yes stop_codon:yes gene_type:complete